MTKRNGIELQSYAAIIACMLITLWTGRKPALRTYEMLCWYFTGMADEKKLLAHNHNMPFPPPQLTGYKKMQKFSLQIKPPMPIMQGSMVFLLSTEALKWVLYYRAW